MSKLSLTNMLGHPYFEHDFQPGPTLVYGPNSAGKTSIALSLAAVTAQQANPLHLPNQEKKLYVTKGSAEGTAALDDGRVIWTGDAISETGGEGAETLPHAVGLVDFCASHRNASDRARAWEALFLPEDPREILEPHWTHTKQQLDALVKQIETEGGWEGAFKDYQAQGRHAKREWKRYAGENYGKAKSKTWKPRKWREGLEEESEESLTAKLADIRDARNRLVAVQAVSAEEISRARHARDVVLPKLKTERELIQARLHAHGKKLGELTKDFREKEARTRELKIDFQRAKDALKATPPHKCPHCDGGLELSNTGQGTIIDPWTPPQESVEELEQAIKDLAAQGKEAVQRMELAKAAMDAKTKDYEGISQEMHNNAAESKVISEGVENADAKESAGVDEAEVERLRNMEEQANDDLLAFKTKRAADREAANVAHYEEICALLGPTGARAELMQEWMHKIRMTVAGLGASVAGWLPVEILRDYSVVSDGIPIRIAAKNEQTKAQWLCQIAIAYVKRDDCDWLILDEADRLKFEDWEGLVKLVRALCHKAPSLKVIVCATDKGDLVPAGWDVVALEGRA